MPEAAPEKEQKSNFSSPARGSQTLCAIEKSRSRRHAACRGFVRMVELELDTDKLDDAALAILSLTLHEGNRVWKGLDWAITD